MRAVLCSRPATLFFPQWSYLLHPEVVLVCYLQFSAALLKRHSVCCRCKIHFGVVWNEICFSFTKRRAVWGRWADSFLEIISRVLTSESCEVYSVKWSWKWCSWACSHELLACSFPPVSAAPGSYWRKSADGVTGCARCWTTVHYRSIIHTCV